MLDIHDGAGKLPSMTNTPNIQIMGYSPLEDPCATVVNRDGQHAFVQASGDRFLVVIEQKDGTYTSNLEIFESYRRAVVAAMVEIDA